MRSSLDLLNSRFPCRPLCDAFFAVRCTAQCWRICVHCGKVTFGSHGGGMNVFVLKNNARSHHDTDGTIIWLQACALAAVHEAGISSFSGGTGASGALATSFKPSSERLGFRLPEPIMGASS